MKILILKILEDRGWETTTRIRQIIWDLHDGEPTLSEVKQALSELVEEGCIEVKPRSRGFQWRIP